MYQNIHIGTIYNIKGNARAWIFERFGFNLPKPKIAKPKGDKISMVNYYIKWKYDLKLLDWVGVDTDGLLTQYVSDYRLFYLL